MGVRVSVLILAWNEEKNIEACIRSVSFASEVVVIDDFSTDRTREIAESLGARVVQRALAGDWGAQQTFAVEQAREDWLFFLDADERVTPALAKKIEELVAADDRSKAYCCARLSYFWGQPLRHGGWFPDYVVRLMPVKGTYVTGYVHQKIHHECTEVKLPRELYLVHYPYRDWEHHLAKMNPYTTLAAKKMVEAGKKPHFWNIILHPFWASFRMYVLRAGFLDGKVGFILAVFHYFYTMEKYVKLYYWGRTNEHVAD